MNAFDAQQAFEIAYLADLDEGHSAHGGLHNAALIAGGLWLLSAMILAHFI